MMLVVVEAEASISTRMLGPDPNTFKAHRVHPIVDPTKFWEGVGDAHTRPCRRRTFVTINGDFATKNTYKCVGGWGSAPDPTGGAYSTPLVPLAMDSQDGGEEGN